MRSGSAGIASIERVSSHPALALPPRLVRQEPGAPPVEQETGGARPATGLINISDLAVEGYGPALSVAQCMELADRLELGPLDGVRARVVALLRDRVAVHVSAIADHAKAQAVEVVAREGAAKAGAGPARHGDRVWEREVRAAVAMVASDVRCTLGEVRAAVRGVQIMDEVPIVAAAALQGLAGATKRDLLAKGWAGVPVELRTDAVAGELVRVVVDNPVPRAKREVRSMLRLMTQATDSATLEDRVRRHAGVFVTDLGGGLAEMVVIDRAENIQVIATLVEAAARTAARHGAKLPRGQARAGVLADLARHSMRHQQVPTVYGTMLDLQAAGSLPVGLQMLQTPIRSVLPPSPGMPNVMWQLRDAGVLTPAQVAALRDDPIWDGIVQEITLIDQNDPDFLAASEVISSTHDGTVAQRRWAARRDGFQCRCPWCTDKSPPTDLHHTTSFATSGQTTVRNLILVHASCHDILHHGWSIKTDLDGTAYFTDPHGQTFATRPQGVVPNQ